MGSMDSSNITQTMTSNFPLGLSLNDAQILALVPVVAYWALSLTFHLFDTFRWFSAYRLYADADEAKKNLAKPGKVLRGVLLQQFLQVCLALLAAGSESDTPIVEANSRTTTFFQGLLTETPFARPHIMLMLHSLYLVLRQLLAFVIIDTYQFFVHYWAHRNRWLYQNIHSQHHQLYTPYAYGALYNHPVEAFFLDSVGGLLSSKLAALSQREGCVFFTLATLKTVDDHCGYQLPWDPISWFGRLTGNDIVYHNIHHQTWGLKTNFSLFFTFWDNWFNTINQERKKLRKSTKGRQVQRVQKDKPRNPLQDIAESTGEEHLSSEPVTLRSANRSI